MAKLGMAAALLCASALAGCGSHNHAPVYYGAAPAASASRIYSAPGAIQPAPTYYGSQPQSTPRAYAAAPSYQQPTYREGVTAAVATSGLAPISPIDETSREGRVSYASEPVYLASAPSTPDYSTPSYSTPGYSASSYTPVTYSAASSERPGEVTVLPGDTVYAISRRTGASPQTIIALNNLAPPYTLSVGQVVRVPSNAVPPSHAATQAQSPTHSPAQSQSEARAEAAHLVRQGDTLYSISRATGVAVGELARANGIRPPYELKIGQTIRVPGGAPAAPQIASTMTTSNAGDISRNVSYEAPPVRRSNMFEWPVQGAIIGNYGLSNAGKRNDGVNIAAPVGTPVRAAADGEIVYKGSELEGYGNLILIKHDDGFVTAYAHNDAMLVKKGDRVRQGQVIAKVGQTGSATEPQLHFEIRQNLKAVDPVALLGSS